MTRIAGLLVGVLWLFFAFRAISFGAEGRAAGHADVAFWWTAAGVLLGIAALSALVGTLRYRYHGPKK